MTRERQAAGDGVHQIEAAVPVEAIGEVGDRRLDERAVPLETLADEGRCNDGPLTDVAGSVELGQGAPEHGPKPFLVRASRVDLRVAQHADHVVVARQDPTLCDLVEEERMVLSHTTPDREGIAQILLGAQDGAGDRGHGHW